MRRFRLPAPLLTSLIWLAASGLSACSGLLTVPATGTAPPSASLAEQLYAEGDYGGAAQAFLRAARQAASDTAKLDYALAAADAAALAEQPQELAEALEEMRRLPRNAEAEARYLLHRAELMVLLGQPRAALDLMPATPPTGSAAVTARFLYTQALARRALGDGPGAVALLVQRDAWLDGPAIRRNRELLWQWLLEAEQFVSADSAATADQITDGWLQLGRIARALWREADALNLALENWLARHPGHPAAPEWLRAAQTHVRATLLSAPRRIALLLPLSGAYAAPAGAVRDGFLAAWYAAGNAEATVVVRDSSIDAAGSYERALAEGAEIVVGPLDRNGVGEVARSMRGEVPVLALNYLEAGESLPAGLTQFGLAPEDEATEAARRAVSEGYRQGVALIAGGDWAQRSLDAFEVTLEAAGGRLLDRRVLPDGVRDYPVVIRDLLQLTDSAARHSALERLFGMQLEFQPTRRQDAEFVFIAASPGQARQLRPQFRFYHAADLPMFASGRAYSGAADPGLDQDLDGVRLCLMPWLLQDVDELSAARAQIAALWPQDDARYARLYALGHDAYNLLPLVRSGRWRDDHFVSAATGDLVLRDGRIERRLPCAEFAAGRLRRLSADSGQ